MSAPSILVLAGDYVEDYELMVPFHTMLTLGYQVHVVCPDKKAGEFIRTSIHDFEGDQTYTEKRGHNFLLNATFAEINPEQYQGLYIPGGRSPEYLRMNPMVLQVTQHFFTANKPVAAICHGIQILTAAGVIEHRTCTAYPACGPEISIAGGTYQPIPLDQAITHGNLVTAPAWPAHPSMLNHFMKLLNTQVING